MSRLTSSVVAVDALPASVRLELLELFRRHYDGVELSTFLHDLEEKDVVILLRDATTAIRGFSTVRMYLRGSVRLLFSGDTVVDQPWWGEQELGRAWCRVAGSVCAEEPEVPLYWLLLSKGHRTYSYLPLFFRDFHPRHGAAIPELERRIRDDFASWKFGDDYDAGRGVVRFASAPAKLRADIADVGEHRLGREHVRFFLQANPGYREGHELVCLARIEPSNLKHFARSCFEEGFGSSRLEAAG